MVSSFVRFISFLCYSFFLLSGKTHSTIAARIKGKSTQTILYEPARRRRTRWYTEAWKMQLSHPLRWDMTPRPGWLVSDLKQCSSLFFKVPNVLLGHFDLWRWHYYVVSKRRFPTTQCCDIVSQQNGCILHHCTNCVIRNRVPLCWRPILKQDTLIFKL